MENRTPNYPEIKSGDDLRNINSYEYLMNIVNAAREIDHLDDYLQLPDCEFLKDLIDKLKIDKLPKYDPEIPYGDLYTKFIIDLEKYLDNKRAEYKGELGFYQWLDPIILTIYANENRALERAALKIEKLVDKPNRTFSQMQDAIKQELKDDDDTTINKTTPGKEGEKLRAAVVMVSSDFKPLASTSMPSVKKYKYNVHATYSEIRMGTQGEKDNKIVRVTPIFEAFLIAQNRKRDALNSSRKKPEPERTKITHVYFNCLPRDSADAKGISKFTKSRHYEKPLTDELEHLENKYENVAVITLPSDKGLLDHKLLTQYKKTTPYDDAFKKFLNIAIGKSNEPVKDFYISDKIKKLIYYGETHEEATIKLLLKKSFNKMGFNENQSLSPADMHAVYFHFIKFELSNYILLTLNPDSFNMSCKDGIDRGGVASAYYNIMKALELNLPFEKNEFFRALHAAPSLVKGRGMNDHIGSLWNAVNIYCHNPKNNNIPDWLRVWVRDNAPEKSRQSYILKLATYQNGSFHTDKKQSKFSSLRTRASTMLTPYTVPPEIESSAIQKLLNILGSPDKREVFTTEEWRILERGELKNVCKEIEENGWIDLESHKPVSTGQVKLSDSKKEISSSDSTREILPGLDESIHILKDEEQNKLIKDMISILQAFDRKTRRGKVVSDLNLLTEGKNPINLPDSKTEITYGIVGAIKVLTNEFRNEILELTSSDMKKSNKWLNDSWSKAQNLLNNPPENSPPNKYSYARTLASCINKLCEANGLPPRFPDLKVEEADREKEGYRH